MFTLTARYLYVDYLQVCYFRLLAIGVRTLVSNFISIWHFDPSWPRLADTKTISTSYDNKMLFNIVHFLLQWFINM